MKLIVRPDKNMTDSRVDEEEEQMEIFPRRRVKNRKYSPVLHMSIENEGTIIGHIQVEMSQEGEVKNVQIEEVADEVTLKDPVKNPERLDPQGTGETGDEGVSLDDRDE